MRVDFYFSEHLHPNSEKLTVLELAQILENKYEVVKTFCEEITREIVACDLSSKRPSVKKGSLIEFIWTKIQRNGFVRAVEIEEWIKNQWRDMARKGKLGGLEGAIVAGNKSARLAQMQSSGKKVPRQKTDPKPFVDTQSYFLALQPKLHLEPRERIGLIRF